MGFWVIYIAGEYVGVSLSLTGRYCDFKSDGESSCLISQKEV